MWIDKGYIVLGKNRNGTVIYEHRVVMEQHLGRPLMEREEVHHKDGNRQNNNLENLEVLSCSAHMSNHRSKWTVHRGNGYSENFLLQKLIDKKKELGRWPQKREILSPHHATYRQRFGKWSLAIEAAKTQEK